MPIVGGAASAVSPNAVGTLVTYIATKMAEDQLQKIRKPITEDMAAMKLDSEGIATLDKRIKELEQSRFIMDEWRGVFHRTQWPDGDITKCSSYFEGQSRNHVYDVTLMLYDFLVKELPQIKSDFQAFQTTGLAAVTEKLASKLRIQHEKKGEEADRLRVEYDERVYPYHLWNVNVEKLTKIE
jgi:hypothetical protein